MLGDDAKPSLVVRAHAPRRGVILIAALAVVGIFLLYVVYELGRYDAGYDRLAVAQERAEHEVDLERMEKSNRQLRTRLAELDTIRAGREREQAEVADRKSTRLNSSHSQISYAVFCLKKKKKQQLPQIVKELSVLKMYVHMTPYNHYPD